MPIDPEWLLGYFTGLACTPGPCGGSCAIPGRFVPNAGRPLAVELPPLVRGVFPLLGLSRCALWSEYYVSTLVTELVEAGVHYGHRASRWNPKMRPYIYARKNLIHIIDVRETIRGLLRAKKYLGQVASRNGLILFVGTKRQAAEAIEREAGRCGMPYVNDRWLGGTLTNFRTIRNRMTRLEELESLRAERRVQQLLQEDAVVAEPRVSQDVPQPERHADHEPAARVPGGGRPEEGKERGPRGSGAGHRDGGT